MAALSMPARVLSMSHWKVLPALGCFWDVYGVHRHLVLPLLQVYLREAGAPSGPFSEVQHYGDGVGLGPLCC
jgi:hypothetical protein